MAMFDARITGGFNDTLVTALTDELAGLETAIIKGALVLEGDQWPGSSSPAWEPVNVTDAGPGAVTVSQLVDAGTDAGHYHWWLWVQVGGLSAVVQVADPDQPELPWHIYVH